MNIAYFNKHCSMIFVAKRQCYKVHNNRCTAVFNNAMA